MSNSSAPRKKRTPSSPAATKAKGVARISATLHGADLDRLDAIEDYLRELGHRERNRSILLKVALRGVELTPALVKHLQAAQADDGRRRQTKQ